MRTAVNEGKLSAMYLVDLLGGTFQVAHMLNIKPPSVSDWKSSNTIPDDKLIRLASKIENISNNEINRKILFPDDWQTLWPELANNDKCACQP
jgi:DNA-binding transcriptional regulator YdaS (Cro superfamily)